MVLVLASILVSGLTPRRLARVQAALGVSAQTVRRWRQWWQNGFVESGLWAERRGLFLPPVAVLDLPNDLVGRFVRRPGISRLLALLRFLSPLTDHAARGTRQRAEVRVELDACQGPQPSVPCGCDRSQGGIGG